MKNHGRMNASSRFNRFDSASVSKIVQSARAKAHWETPRPQRQAQVIALCAWRCGEIMGCK
ncbi:MAG TPA: hypothetical protein VHZ51_14345 [Ktedonobacteraceae bacterium]|jgi:hypothetical protein|nr:hypothetical protein [Ktedonobacteraceae bacterium]